MSLEANQPETLRCERVHKSKANTSYFLGNKRVIVFSIDFSSIERQMEMERTNMVEKIPQNTTKKAEKILLAILSTPKLKASKKVCTSLKAAMPRPCNMGDKVSKY